MHTNKFILQDLKAMESAKTLKMFGNSCGVHYIYVWFKSDVFLFV